MEYRVLGPLTAVSDGKSCNLGGPRQRMVLAVLLVNADRVVSQDLLIDTVWAGDPPSAAKTTLHGYVSHLRREVGEDLVREGDGYRVLLDDNSLDALRFEDLVDEGRDRLEHDPASAVAALERALGLWYGTPYGDLDSPALAIERGRLEGLRQVAVENRIEADLALGNHARVIGELESLVREHPYQEKLHGMLMLALYRSGRQAEALRAYQRTRDMLAEELGIEPSTELRDLEQRILEQSSDLDLKGEAQRVALLFTDIAGSTLLWERYPREVPASLENHFTLLGDAVRTMGGRVFKQNGDGICAVFSDVESAVRASRTAQEGLAAAGWGPTGAARARMGIDVGEVESRRGDYFGAPVSRCARITASGHGGQVLLSAEAHEELSASGSEYVARPLGAHRFPGLGSAVQVFELQLPGIDREFPPLDVGRRPRALQEHPTRTIRGYELREAIGEGDYGVVYRAFQPSVGREVAVKVIRPEFVNHPAFVRRFEAEAHLVAELEHPHIVSLHDYWRDPEGAYLVMPLFRGGSLTETLRRGPWNLAPALRLLDQLGSAVGYAHRQGVIHRDIKPGNVLLDSEGNGYLSDFGIATRLVDEVGAPMTTSVAYIPPEETRGEPLTPRSDIFCMGVLALHVLTGVRPTGNAPLPVLSDARPGLPVELGEVLQRATDSDPENRYERVEDFLRAVRRAVGTDVVAVSEPPEPVPPRAPMRNPYKGLRAFKETDAVDFHGRGVLIDELLRAVGINRLVAVVGPSGSGKSSVVRAGLVPALRAGGLPSSRGWLVAEMFPGSFPFEELEAALLRVATTRPTGLIDDLTGDERGLLRVSKQILPSDDSQLVLIIDQFEELFSMLHDEATRRLFLESLAVIAGDERSRVRVVITFRADFFDRPLEYPRFGDALTRGLVTVSPPAEEGLAQAIAAPARGVGLALEPGLVGRIITDVEGQPGGLPLLQYALTELFNRRDETLLTIEAYESTGGVLGALGRRAEELYEQLPPRGKQAARQLFLRLVTVDETAEDTRRRVRQTELKTLAVDQKALDRVLEDFGSFRLLSFDRDPVTRGPTVEVAHEALLREWDRLRGWIDSQRESLLFHRRLHISAREWDESGRDSSFLLRGGRLEQAQRWAEAGGIALTGEEEEYLAESRDLHVREVAIERRRRRAVIWSLIIALVVFAALAATAWLQGERAATEARDATARRLAGDSALALAEDPELAILLALKAADLSRDAGEPLIPETISALHRAVQTSRLELRLDDRSSQVAVSPDGSLLATDSSTGEVVIRDAVTAELLRTIQGEAGSVEDLAFSPDGRSLAVSYLEAGEREQSSEGHILVLNPRTGEEMRRLDLGAVRIVWSPAGELLATATESDGTRASLVTVWDMGTGTEKFSVTGASQEIAFADPATLLVGDPVGRRVNFYASTGDELVHLDTPGFAPQRLVVDHRRSRLVMGSFESREAQEIQVWDLDSRSLVWNTHVRYVAVLNVSSETGVVASSGSDGQVRLHHPEDGSVLITLDGHTGGVLEVAFYPAGEVLASVGTEGETRVWDVTPPGSPETSAVDIASLGAPYPLAISPDGSKMASSHEGLFFHLDLATGQLLRTVDLDLEAYRFPAPLSPNWQLLASVDSSGEAWVQRLASGNLLSLLPSCTIPMGFNHDGSALVLDGVQLCSPAETPVGVELRSRVIDPSSGAELLDLGQRRITGPWVVFNPGGVFEPSRYVAFMVGFDAVEIHDMETGGLVASLSFENELIDVIAPFDPTGRYLAGGTMNGRAWVLDMEAVVDGAPIHDALIFNRTVDAGGVPGVALNADGILATVAFGSLRLWDIHTGRLVVDLVVDIDSPPFAAFSPGGDYLFYGDTGYAGTVLRRFPIDTDALIEQAESRVTRGLTTDECLRYLDPSQCG